MVEAAACSALGKQQPDDEIVSLLLEKSNDTSWANRVRQSAVGALAALGDERGIEPAKKLAAYGGPFRARGTGIDALARLHLSASKERQKEIREFLLGQVNDPQERNAMSAIRALGATGDREAITGLQRLVSSGAHESRREAAREAIRQIEEQDQTAVIRELRERLDAIEKRMEAQQLEERGGAMRRAG
jgi:HEAT repeat protein